MDCTRRTFIAAASTALVGLAACVAPVNTSEPAEPDASAPPEPAAAEPDATEPAEAEKPKPDLKKYASLKLNPKAWKHDKNNDVYYQLGVPYCLDPASELLESLAIFVPGAYLTAADEEAEKPVYEIDPNAKVGAYTPLTAPVVMPINSGTLGPQSSPTSYSYAGLGTYLSAGCVYVYAGFRGRSSGYESGGDGVFSGGDPWPVVDLKAAVRFLRLNANLLPCNTNRIFTCGFSAGGGVSALMGCTGDSELYAPYLEKVGAVAYDDEGEPISDAVFGSASWCPVTSFDTADASYEWMMGQYASAGTRADGTWTKLLSADLAAAYAGYVNNMDLCDENDAPLALDESAEGIYAAGSYYDYLLRCVEDAASSFFATTPFPYTYTPQHIVSANFPGDPNLQSTGAGTDDVEAVTGDASATAAGAAGAAGATDARSEARAGKTSVQSVVYNTSADYVDDLNGDSWWFTYNQRNATVRISSLGDFVRHFKNAAKDVGAFDAPDRSTYVNQLFGTDEVGSLHFSQMVSDQIVAGRDDYAEAEGWDDKLVQDWTGDLIELDALQTSMATRMNMFNPLYFLSGRYDGFGTAEVAPHWRVNTGLFQTDTSLCTEVNLVLALAHCEGVSSVEFTPVWGQGHVLAEASGSAEDNLLAWIASCCKKAKED